MATSTQPSSLLLWEDDEDDDDFTYLNINSEVNSKPRYNNDENIRSLF